MIQNSKYIIAWALFFMAPVTGMHKSQKHINQYGAAKTSTTTTATTPLLAAGNPASCMSTRQKKCLGAFVGTIIGIGAVYFIEQASRCQVSFSQYPVCGLKTVDGVDANQIVLSNYFGNIRYLVNIDNPNGGRYFYADGYCQQPLRTVCTNFKSYQYTGLAQACYAIKVGKLLGVVTADREYQDTKFCVDDTCLNAPKRIENHFNQTKKRYCKISPEQVGFERIKNLLLTLYLLDMNATSAFVQPDRWGDPNNLGEYYGPSGRCKATWSNNVDPSARLKPAQQKRDTFLRQNVINRTSLLRRSNKRSDFNKTNKKNNFYKK